MAEIVLLGEVQDLAGIGTARKKKRGAGPRLPKLMKIAPPLPPVDMERGARLIAEMTSVRSSPRSARPSGAVLDAVSAGLERGVSTVERLGSQVVNVLEAGTRFKQATAAKMWQVDQAWDRFQGQSWFDLELIPGVKNLYLVLGAGGLLAVLLMNRGK